MSTVAPSVIAKDLIVAAGVGTFAATTGWGIFLGRMPSSPDTAITLGDSGGQNPNPAYLVDFKRFQIRVRGSKGKYSEAYNKAQEIKDALLGLPSQTIGTDRVDGIIMNSDISFLGYDENNRAEFSLNFRMIIEPQTGTYRTSL